MKLEIRLFFTALMFYTRIPCPKWVDHSAEYINKSIRYFPVIGWLVGLISAAAFLIGSATVNAFFGIIMSFIVSVLTTGAFHEDGFADVCDGFGGGWTKDKILVIMKDSRVGAYGVVGLILLYLIKTSVLFEVTNQFNDFLTAGIIICAHTLSRSTAALLVFTNQYVRDTDDSKAKPVAEQSSNWNLILIILLGIVPLVAFVYITHNYILLSIIPLLYLVKARFGWYFKKWIGGYTGDCLGATQQVAEVSVYLFMVILWKFI